MKRADNEADKAQLVEGLNKLAKCPTIKMVHIGAPAATNRAVIERTYSYSWLCFFDNAADEKLCTLQLSTRLRAEPAAIERSRLYNQQAEVPLQTGVPAQLLANRPDVQQAEWAYRSAFELTNVARAAFYPALIVTGAAGLSSLTLADFINPTAIAASIGAGLTQPIFNRRLIRTNLIVAQAEQQASLFNFRNVLLTAGQEVSDARSLHARALEKMTVRRNQISALQKSVEFTQELLRNRFANYNEVITAWQSLLTAQLGGVNDKLQELQAPVNLYRSLGGGWR